MSASASAESHLIQVHALQSHQHYFIVACHWILYWIFLLLYSISDTLRYFLYLYYSKIAGMPMSYAVFLLSGRHLCCHTSWLVHALVLLLGYFSCWNNRHHLHLWWVQDMIIGVILLKLVILPWQLPFIYSCSMKLVYWWLPHQLPLNWW